MAQRRSTLPVRRPGPGESSSLASRLLAPALAAALLLGAFQPLAAQVPQASASIEDDPRVRAASQWLAHLDEGDLDAAWRSASERTREIFPEKAWRSTLDRARQDLGELVSREATTASEVATPPGAPAGEYASVVFRSRFTEGALRETVTLVRSGEDEQDRRWAVFGYRAR